MTKVQDLQQAINTKNKIDGRIIELEDDICRESNTDAVCNKEKRNRYENIAKESMKLKKER